MLRYIQTILLSLCISGFMEGSTSVVVPCSYKHAQHLYSLLELYEHQTELPDEVVISLSEAHRVPVSVVTELQDRLWVFPVNVITTNQKKYAGENRNIACQHAKGDVLICQDADDLPHPQRVEVIKYFFNKYSINQLVHQYIKKDEEWLNDFKIYDINNITYAFINSYPQIWSFKPVHFGNIAISKQVFNAIQWSNKPRGQDIEYNQKVFDRFRRCLVIQVPLLVYRAGLSTNKFKRFLLQQ